MTASGHRTQGHLPRLLTEDEIREQEEKAKAERERTPARRVVVKRGNRRGVEVNIAARETH